MPRGIRTILAVWVLVAGGVSGHADEERPAPAAWPDTWIARLEALALLQTFQATLLSHDSATESLQNWCADHSLASPAKVAATRVGAVDRPASEDVRRQLGVSPAEPVKYRRVQLHCGPLVLSEADNWYVPGRLTPEMNRVLDTTDTPFGRAVRELHFVRRTLSSTLLWSPLPEGWEMQAADTGTGNARLVMPRELLRTAALLIRPDGSAVSEVVETYTAGLLAFPPPPFPPPPQAPPH